MSKGIRMALVMNLLPVLFLAAFVRSDQSTTPLISFKIGENVTYDCIDIYKQPALDHPLLKNHTIQMKPSVSSLDIRNQTRRNKTYKNKIKCPDGTVPILRNAEDFITNVQPFSEKFFHPLTADSPGTHIVGLRSQSGPFRGVESWFNAYNLNIKKDQASYSQIYIGSGLNNQVNFISAGFMINPGFFPDGRVWTYGFWKGKDGKGCYNTACSGFVQVSQRTAIVQPIDLKPGTPIWLQCRIHQDQQTGNWWLTQLQIGPDDDIGYWPKELFNLLDNGANMAGVGGVVQASHSGSSPPMGNGRFPVRGLGSIAGVKKSAIFTNIEVLSSRYKSRRINYYPIEKLEDNTKCYGLNIGARVPILMDNFGYYFNYGGPGGNYCGI